jgi:hypothetical protein
MRGEEWMLNISLLLLMIAAIAVFVSPVQYF